MCYISVIFHKTATITLQYQLQQGSDLFNFDIAGTTMTFQLLNKEYAESTMFSF